MRMCHMRDQEGQPPAKKRRFEPSYVEDSEWSLPTDMADYFVKQCLNFVKPSEIEEHIVDIFTLASCKIHLLNLETRGYLRK